MIKKLAKKIALVVCIIFFLGVIFVFKSNPDIDDEQTTNVSEEQIKKNEEYFNIVDMIYSGKYVEAENKMEDIYGNISYQETDGTNKMLLYKLLYDKQELYDEEFLILIEYLQVNDISKYTNMKKDDIENLSIRAAIDSIREIKYLISEENRQLATDVLGEKLFTDKTVEEYNEEFLILVETLQMNNIDIDKYKNMEKEDIEDLSTKIIIDNVIEIKDKISEENRELANEIFGEKLLIEKTLEDEE